jgi:maltooligosyltrehalose trehalohydrolase
MMQRPVRRLPIGAELQPGGGAHFRVWAANAQAVSVEVDGSGHALTAEGDGYFGGFVAAARDGSRYGFRLDAEEKVLPDPVSRFQPDGPHERSRIVDPTAFAWTDAAWHGVELRGQILYELHIGTFTPQGTWRAAADKLALLAEAGVSVIEMMPVAEFPGRFGWGYDGVSLFAPTRLYGEPDDLRYFIDRAHQIGLGVILDVVYNHFGPDGNYLPRFAATYLTDRYDNEWGAAINFDGPGSAPVREFILANAAYWISEFHFDGLRLDATQQIFDTSPEHIVACVAREVRRAGLPRTTLLVAENDTQETRLVRPAGCGGYGLDAVWNDDFHHSAMVALIGKREAYYSDTEGDPQEFISAAKYGYLFQGQWYEWQRQARGTLSFDIEPAQFVTFLQNHDQVANSGRGQRPNEVTSPGRWRAMTAVLLLSPGTPMLFQGQEFSASAPFLYFADHEPELAAGVGRGRAAFLNQFPRV